MRKLQQESARISEQRDALRMEVKAGKKREQDAETALASLKLDIRSRKAADGNKLAAAAESFSSLSDRTEQARKNADGTLSKTDLSRRVPLVGRALGRMERCEHCKALVGVRQIRLFFKADVFCLRAGGRRLGSCLWRGRRGSSSWTRRPSSKTACSASGSSFCASTDVWPW